MPIQDNFAEQFIRGHALGTESRRRKEEMEALKEEREWVRKIKEHELKREAIQDKLHERILGYQEAENRFKMMTGGPGKVPARTHMQLPEQGADPGQAAFGLPGGGPRTVGPIIPESAYRQNEPVEFPSLLEGGKSMTLTPPTKFALEQEQARQAQQRIAEKIAEQPPSFVPEKSRGVFQGGKYTPLPQIPGAGKEIERSIDLGDKVRIYHTDGTVQDVKKGMSPGSATSINLFGMPVKGVNTVNPTATGEDYLKTIPDKGLADRARAIIDGREAPPTGRAAYQGAGSQLMEIVHLADPGWTTERAQIRKAYVSGSIGKNINALNTAPVHLDRLASIATALKTGDIQLLNQAKQAYQKATGRTAPGNFEAVKIAVAGEMANALTGTATIPEIAEISKNIQGMSSPEQMEGVINENIRVLEEKLTTYWEAYLARNEDDVKFKNRIFFPRATEIFARRGVVTEHQGQTAVNPQVQQYREKYKY